MKYILLLTLLFFNFSLGGALSTATAPKAPNSGLEKIQTEAQVEQQEKQAQTQQKASTKATNYFANNISFASCSGSCPPLQSQYQAEFVTKLDSFSMDTGAISCTVYHNLDIQQIKPIQSQSFINQKCLNQVQNVKYQSQVSTTAEKNNENLAKSVNNSIAISSAEKGNLDLADYITALVTFNSEIIDIQKSLNNQTIEFQSGVTFDNLQTTQTHSDAIDYVRSASQGLFNAIGLEGLNPMSPPNFDIQTQNANQKFLDKFLLFFFETLLVSSTIMSDILWYLFLLSLLWSVLDIAFNFHKMKEDKFYIPKRAAFSILIIWFFFIPVSGTSVTAQGQNISVDSTRAQSYFSLVVSEINSVMDTMVSKTWQIYLSSLNSREGVLPTNTIKANEKELNQLKAKNTELQKINDKCFQDYDMTAVKQSLQKVTNQKQNQVFANPFPSQQEFEKIGKNENSFLKPDVKPSISLSACYSAKQSILSNTVRIDSYQKNIDNFNNPSFLNDKKEQLQSLNDYFFSLNQKFGWISIVFLPSAEMMFQLKDFLTEVWDKKIADLKGLEFEKITQGVLQNIAMFTLLPLDNIIQIVKFISKILPTSWIPIVGESFDSAISLVLIIFSVDFLVEILKYSKTIVFFLVATYMILLLFAEYLLTFIKIPFATVWALATNQREKIVGIIANVVYVSLKAILLFLAILICLFILFLVGNISDTFINEIPLLAAQFGWVSNIVVSFLSGFLIILKIVLEVAIIISTILYIPKSFGNSLKVEINDLTDTVNQVMAQKIK
ncbi:hypothetical protein N5912_10045 [Arcobacter lacus]|uniref:hypothetical protein n=1 Tax=Arcobacter lacus TaxID=1912876 RepID=UPI0021BB8336|nr:hypothetical protein [Arcobacter lacus]MCT7912169.1 hypothetical protein [Arcobacter lacus]